MVVIKLDATDSTNSYLKNMLHNEQLADFTVVSCDHQLKGRGQMGTTWLSDRGKNLTFSILKKYQTFNATDQFQISCMVSLALYRVLSSWAIPNLSLKWPNDILSGNQKICGILIENILKGSYVNMSIIGVGLNVNQTRFENLKNVASLKQLMKVDFDRDVLLNQIVQQIKYDFEHYAANQWTKTKGNYEDLLFKRDKPCTFKNDDGKLFMGIIKGINDEGKLMIAIDNDDVQFYGFKEISLLY